MTVFIVQSRAMVSRRKSPSKSGSLCSSRTLSGPFPGLFPAHFLLLFFESCIMSLSIFCFVSLTSCLANFLCEVIGCELYLLITHLYVPACQCMYHVYTSAWGGQKRGPDPLGLSCRCLSRPLEVGNEPMSFLQEQQVLPVFLFCESPSSRQIVLLLIFGSSCCILGSQAWCCHPAWEFYSHSS